MAMWKCALIDVYKRQLLPHLGVDKGRQIIVQGVEQLLGPLNDGHVHSKPAQVFRQLQADISAARQDCGAGLLPLHERPDAQSVLHGPQRKEPVQSHTWLLYTSSAAPFAAGLYAFSQRHCIALLSGSSVPKRPVARYQAWPEDSQPAVVDANSS